AVCGVTRACFHGSISTKPSSCSRTSACRIGERLIPSVPASWVSVSVGPGDRVVSTIIFLIAPYAPSASGARWSFGGVDSGSGSVLRSLVRRGTRGLQPIGVRMHRRDVDHGVKFERRGMVGDLAQRRQPY